MAALMFWSMKNKTDKVNPKHIDVRIPLIGSASSEAILNSRSPTIWKPSTVGSKQG